MRASVAVARSAPVRRSVRVRRAVRVKLALRVKVAVRVKLVLRPQLAAGWPQPAISIGACRLRPLPASGARKVLVKPPSDLEERAISRSPRGHEPSSSPRVPPADVPEASVALAAPLRHLSGYRAAPRASPPLPYEVLSARQSAEQRRGHQLRPTVGPSNWATSSRCRRPDLHMPRERGLLLPPPSAADRRAPPRRCWLSFLLSVPWSVRLQESYLGSAAA